MRITYITQGHRLVSGETEVQTKAVRLQTTSLNHHTMLPLTIVFFPHSSHKIEAKFLINFMRKQIALSRPFILPFLLALKLVIDNNLVLFFIKFFFFLFLDSQDPGSFMGFMTLQRSYIAASIAKMSSTSSHLDYNIHL